MSGLSRRALIRTGVTSAWTVPVVAVAVPASAAACSGPLPQLTATEVQGTRVETFDLYRGELAVYVKINVANSGAAGALVSVTVDEDAEYGGFRTFTLGQLASGDIGTAVPVGDENFLTVTASPTVPLAGPTNEFIVEYAMIGSPAQYRTVTVTFQPDCGAAAVCTIVSYNGPT